ncbi:thermonuclease family protein [Ramlibacter tataouinensis]|uniref:Nuclease-like protein n=1 Tax=Ramlibacter tataouinensis (strain ATCC BAA-407 / DSM 14655 / LMG 21543 / TTB310) TaxID=365046 RepID=F5Y1D0_RAMTT|nr:thermonuclease family protein [Ramlibacter tataouinensis]AEG94714.1 nuclease-like protein [Ramlibacter tataouinensis TTB310]
MRGILRLAGLWAALALAPALGADFSGVVTRVTDGDTLWVRPAAGGRPREVRLQGLDAPEICQAHGPRARAALAARLQGRRVQVRIRARDDYGRWLSRVATPDDPDVGAWMVVQGHAWSYRFRDSRGPYAALEDRARQARRGLWAQAAPLEPREFRRRHGSCGGAGQPGTRPNR